MCGSELPKNVTSLKLLHTNNVEGNSKQKRSYDVLSNEHSIGTLEVEGYLQFAKDPSKSESMAFQPCDEIFIPTIKL